MKPVRNALFFLTAALILSCESPTGSTASSTVKLAIDSHPLDQYVTTEMDADFSIKATGVSIEYQWYSDTGMLSDQNSSTLRLSDFSKDDSGSLYWCSVVSSEDTLTSETATLHVVDEITVPTVTVPQDVYMATVGDPVTMSVEAVGVAISCQWEKNGTPIAGAIGPDYTISAVTLGNNEDVYTCVVTNSEGSVTSDPIRVVAKEPSLEGMWLMVNMTGGNESLNFSLTDTSAYFADEIWKISGNSIDYYYWNGYY